MVYANEIKELPMCLISIEPLNKRLPRLYCTNCNKKPPVVKAQGVENEVIINMVLCLRCLCLAVNGYIEVLKRNRQPVSSNQNPGSNIGAKPRGANDGA